MHISSLLSTCAAVLLLGQVSVNAAPAATSGGVLRVGDYPDLDILLKRDGTVLEKRQRLSYQQLMSLASQSRASVAAAESSKSAAAAAAAASSTTTTTAAPSPVATADPALATAVLNEHNSFRAKHAAPAMTWSQPLADAAAKWAKNCVFQHSQGAVG